MAERDPRMRPQASWIERRTRSAARAALAFLLLHTSSVAAETEAVAFAEDYSLAKTPRNKRERRHFFSDYLVSVEARLGFGTPVGYLGVLIGKSLYDRLELGAGGGLASAGPALASYARVRPVVWERALSGTLHSIEIELAYSFSDSRLRELFAAGLGHNGDSSETIDVHAGHWIQPEVAWHMVRPTGFGLRAGAGYAFLVGASRVTCESGGAPCEVPERPFAVIGALSFGVIHNL